MVRVRLQASSLKASSLNLGGHAYKDLHQIRFNFPGRAVCGALTSFKQILERPHPYNSRQNDIVRHFLLEQLREIAKDHDFIYIRVEDDV
jgi:hypothetical protein